MKRTEGVISWTNFFMGVAELASRRSKDPDTQHGACIVNVQNKIVSVGYNGLANNLNDDGYTDTKNNFLDYWAKPQKYDFVVHAEENAILNAQGPLVGTKLYLFSSKGYLPCCSCAKSIIQAGITHLVVTDFIKTTQSEIYKWDSVLHLLESTVLLYRIQDGKEVPLFSAGGNR